MRSSAGGQEIFVYPLHLLWFVNKYSAQKINEKIFALCLPQWLSSLFEEAVSLAGDGLVLKLIFAIQILNHNVIINNSLVSVSNVL
ncbi:hypothetical protein TNCT_296791 [Trichonephila clavata]|uniref:Uncharacterized protein n=1 Tax=Trichonephila clavata TaxID=2740835 RepID=A0A8X6M400_TRICU|nr:hypothetical protein TNCT_296791 [Trichonephila clavata]